jgi:capsular polysaccharide biosynthesis protein
MRESFDAYEYIEAMRQRWRVVAIACLVAGTLALVVSLLLPKRYTATASILIEPAAANDARTATAVSPVYLESLKTYERFAASDTLFARAAEQFHLRDTARQSIESLKRRILKVNKLRDTRILEMSVTLTDPKLAQKLVEFLAEETVNSSRKESLASDSELIEEARNQLSQARKRLEAAKKVSAENGAGEAVEGLRTDVDASMELLVKLRQQLVNAETDVAEYQAREKSLAASSSHEAADIAYVQQQLNAAKARAGVIERRMAELQRSVTRKSQALGRGSARGDEARMELENAQSAFETASNRLRDTQAAAGTRGERLRIIDPAIVPERPSSPNVFFNLLAALLVAVTASLVVLSLRFAMQRAKPARLREPAPRGVSMR